MNEEERQKRYNEECVAEEPPCESEEQSAEGPEQGGGKKKSDVGIFIFLGVMLLLMLAAIGFVIYICSGQASGCNCGQCS